MGLPLYLFLGIGVLIAAMPFVYMLSNSFKLNSEIYKLPIRYIPENPVITNYIRLFTETPFVRQYWNSTILAVSQTAVALIVASLGAFGFAKYEFRGKKWLFTFLLATMMIPAQTGYVPMFILMYRFGWLDTYWALILPRAANAFGIFLLRQIMITNVPSELLDAGRIDGASELVLFRRIALPLCKGGLGVLGVLSFMGAWNEFIWPLIILRTEKMYTVPIGLASLVNLYKVEYGMVMAGSLLATLPILIILSVVGQKHFVSGLTIGAIKG